MQTLEQALKLLKDYYPQIAEVITLPVNDCLGKVVAADILSTVNVPLFDNSAMDGYAILLNANLKVSTPIKISQYIKAGDKAEPVEPDTAARIFTGAMLPPNANAVVVQENCERFDDNVLIHTFPECGTNIRRAGEDIKEGQCIVSKGTCVNAAISGLIASSGTAACRVYRPLKIGILSTGNELVTAGQPLQQGKIYSSNSIVLKHLCETSGYEVIVVQHVMDDYKETVKILKVMAEQVDVIISTGGVSVGEEDHVKAALRYLGEIHLWKIALKPGKPLAAGRIGRCAYFGLPGNPVSAYVTFQIIVEPMLAQLQGKNYQDPMKIPVIAGFDKKGGSRQEFIRVSITLVNSELVARPYSNQSSGVLSSIVYSDGVVEQLIGQPIKAGDRLNFFKI